MFKTWQNYLKDEQMPNKRGLVLRRPTGRKAFLILQDCKNCLPKDTSY